MIGWLQPSALWALGLLALPVAIHLLRPRRARRVEFPAVRFVPSSRTAAVRFRPPSDLVLLAIRLAIAGAAVLAAARPVWVSSTRLAAWDARTARAVVIQTSTADAPAIAAAARALAEGETAGDLSYRIEHPDLREGVRRARAWLETAPPARREIVLISPFRFGSIEAHALAGVEPSIGLRFVPVTIEQTHADVAGLRLLAAPGEPALTQHIRLSSEGTSVALESSGATGAASQDGLRIAGEGGPASATRLVAALARAGTPAPDPSEPIALVFVGGAIPAGPRHPSEPWMIRTLQATERSRELRALARDIAAVGLEDAESWTTLLADGEGRPLVRAAAADGELVLQAAVPASSYFAAALARAALAARGGPAAHPEQDVLTIPRETLDAWSRAPEPVAQDVWRRSVDSDARWLWAVALILMGVEAWLRAPARVRTEDLRAAA